MTDGRPDNDSHILLPRPAVGAVVKHDNRFLLVKRANPPSKYRWSIPGGKIKPGETLQEAAQREVLEETGIVIVAGHPILTFDHIEKDAEGNLLFHYIIVDLIARYVSGKARAGGDALDAVWVHEQDLEEYMLGRAALNLLQSL